MRNILNIIILLVILESISLIFIAFPEIDIYVSNLFYDKQEGFYLKNHEIIEISYRSIFYITPFILGLCVFSLLIFWLNRRSIKFALPVSILDILNKIALKPRISVFLLLCAIITPGIMAHQITKPYFERPRPRAVQEFGGQEQFIPIYSIGHNNGKSFMSGHIGMAFFFCAFAFLYIKNRKLHIMLYSLGIAFGLWMSMVRIAQGGHFLSDVLISGLLTIITIHILYLLVLKNKLC